jgi:hypothetical protein
MALKIPALRPAISDENIYFYMAWRMSEGALPYRDFFYANPPGLLVPGTVLTFLFGPRFLLLKALPMVAALGALMLTYILIARRIRALSALLCVTAWMVSGTFIRASSHWTGINVTTFLLVLAIFLMEGRKGLWAGAVVALAGLTKTYGLVALPALWLGVALQGRESHRRFLLGFFPLTLAANAALLAFGGRDFIRQTIQYHMAKPPNPAANREAIDTIAEQSVPWIIVAAIGFVLVFPYVLSQAQVLKRWVARRRAQGEERPDPLLWTCVSFIICFLLFMAIQKRVFSFYILPVFPVICILLGEGIRQLESARIRWRAKLPAMLRRVPVAILLAVPIAASHGELGKYLGHERDYGFPEAYAIAAYVQETTGPEETIFGYSGAAPLVAFLAERRLANDEADTNAMRFRSGMDDVLEVFHAAEKDNLRYLVALWRRDSHHVGIFRIREFHDEVTGRYEVARAWKSPKGTYRLYARRPSPRPTRGSGSGSPQL